MNTKKLRGHNRIFKNIENWKNESLNLDLEQLQQYQRNYEKVWVRPFGDISISGAAIPKPKRKARKLILKALIEIFNSWDTQLKTLGEPYYLAIWLHEPNIEKSQVVCATGEFLNFYDITYYRPEVQRKMPVQNYGKLKDEIASFNWIYALDEHHFTTEDINKPSEIYATNADYYATQKWFKRQLKKPLRISKSANSIQYATTIGNVWIGTKN